MRACLLLLVLLLPLGAEEDLPTNTTKAEEAPLLERIVAAQAGREHAVGVLVQRTWNANRPKDDPPVQKLVRVAVAVPGRYNLLFTDLDDPSGEFGGDRMVCDGNTRWTMNWFSLDEKPDITKEPVDGDDGAWATIKNFFPLDTVTLSENFELLAEPLIETPTAHPNATHQVRLVPRKAEWRDEVSEVRIVLNAAFDTQAVIIQMAQDGTRQEYVVQNMDYDTPVDLSQFSVQE